MAINLRDLSVYGVEPIPGEISLRDISVYAIEQAPAQVVARAITGHMLVDDPRHALLRAITGVALTELARAPDFSVAGPVALLAAINREFKLTLTAAQVKFQAVATLSHPFFNTVVTLAPLHGFPYAGSFQLQYRRYSLPTAFAGKDVGNFTTASATIHGALSDINSAFGLALTAADVVDGPISGGFTLVAATTSLWFVPGTQIGLGTAGVTDLAVAITLGDLTGFTPA